MLSILFTWLEELSTLQNQIEASPSESIDMVHQVTNFTKSMITVLALGIEPDNTICDYFYTEQCLYHLKTIFDFGLESAIFPMPRWLWSYIPHCYQIEQAARVADTAFTAACKTVIDYKQHLFTSGQTLSHQYAMLDSLFQREESGMLWLSAEEILANVKVFYLAGSDTTASTLTWICYYYAIYPEVAEKVRDEFIAYFASKNKKKDKSWPSSLPQFQAMIKATATANGDCDGCGWETNDFQQLTYCQAVVKETIRLKAPGNFLYLEVNSSDDANANANEKKNKKKKDKDVMLSNGLIIESDTSLFLNIDSMLLREDPFTEPSSFCPERWLASSDDNNEEKLKKMEQYFLAFGGGTRVCPGMGLALLEATTAAALLAYFFVMELTCPVAEIQRIQSFTVSANKMPIRLTLRDNKTSFSSS